jgi:hypothetical protein
VIIANEAPEDYWLLKWVPAKTGLAVSLTESKHTNVLNITGKRESLVLYYYGFPWLTLVFFINKCLKVGRENSSTSLVFRGSNLLSMS